jgi:HTH-type transcriptional regulator / antitoxin MqsA
MPMKHEAKTAYPDTIDCYLCGGESRWTREVRPVPIGFRTAVIEDDFYRCSACGEVEYLGDMADETSRRAVVVIRAEDGLLGPDDIIALREKYGLSQAALERLIGAGEKTVVRWERGTVAQNKTADTLLRVLGDHPEAVAQLARERGVELRSRKRAARTRAPKPKASPAPARRARADAG